MINDGTVGQGFEGAGYWTSAPHDRDTRTIRSHATRDTSMNSPQSESSLTTGALGAVAIALMLLVPAMDAAAQFEERTWTVDCGLPQEDSSFLALLPTGGYTGPWPGDPRSGHLEAKTLNRPNPEGGLVTEMWLLSRAVGWWKLKAMWVHPDDQSKLIENLVRDAIRPEIRQIIDSPFLSKPAIVRAGNSDDEEMVNGQILALLPDASQLRCGPQSEGTD